MRKLLFTLTFFAVLALLAPTAFAENGKGNRQGRRDRSKNRIEKRDGTCTQGAMDPFLANPSEAMKAEVKRHRDEIVKIRTELRELSTVIRSAVRDAVDVAVSAAKAKKDANPNGEYEPVDISKVVESVKAKYKDQLTSVTAKMIDETILHTEKKLAIMKAERATKIEECAENICDPKNRRSGRANCDERGNGREGRNRGDRPNRNGR